MIELAPISYEAEGKLLSGFVADGSKGSPAPGILVAHEAVGLGEHSKARARMFAELGYVALAIDMFGESGIALDRARELNLELRKDSSLLRRRCQAALDTLVRHPSVDGSRIAGIGYCFGGYAMIQLARTGAPLAGIVGLHSGFPEPNLEEDRRITGRVLFCMGAEDPVIPAPQRDSYVAGLGEAKVDWQLHIYGGVGHSFTNPEIDSYGFPGFAYDASADRRSWETTRLFLNEAFA